MNSDMKIFKFRTQILWIHIHKLTIFVERVDDKVLDMLLHISKLFQLKDDMISVYDVIFLSQFDNYVDLSFNNRHSF